MATKSTIRSLGISLVLVAALPMSPAMAEPGRGGFYEHGIVGPGIVIRHGGPGRAAHWAPGGPGHGHGLPGNARGIWVGATLFFLAAGTYYLWDASQEQYLPVQAPAPATLSAPAVDVIAYPSKGQHEDQIARDRYECHRWANQQSDAEVNSVAPPVTAGNADIYRRALSACLAGRGYSVQ
ncbi:hypothetical protein [Cobetia sp. QF-1]|uniref:hypothetical protein n=1 Tax=Cobetia sp. QF-1 TaxID=1969833 RepID=UPI000B546233|nr:hypothetical protein [Cobetia sp. QF-1]